MASTDIDFKQVQFDFLVSALHPGLFITTDQVLEWMEEQNHIVESRIEQIPLEKLKGWSYTDNRIRHESGKFFSIDGIRISTNYRGQQTWDQPIINQPEIGFLGFIVKKFKGIYHFLVQAKIEPGNLNIVQLSPTLQATRSNYTCVHKGKRPTYLEYFNGEKPVKTLLDQLQSEQGARFLHKRNRNIIVEVAEDTDIEVKDGFMWLSLRQIKELISHPNVLNMDTRTVISCITYGSYDEATLKLVKTLLSSRDIHPDGYLYSVLSSDNHLNDLRQIIQWITELKFKYELEVKPIGISDMKHWIYDGNTIYHEDHKYFDVIGVNVAIGNREIISWDQPMIRSAQEGIMGFLVKKINGIYHFPRPRQTRSRQLRYCRNGSYRTVSDRQLSEREKRIYHTLHRILHQPTG